MTFTDAHSPSAVCAPTRYGVLTGRYCWRTHYSRCRVGIGKPALHNVYQFRHHASRITAESDRHSPWVAASGVLGAEEIRIPLGGDPKIKRSYRVRLHFAEMAADGQGGRAVGVAVQDQTVLEDFDIRQAADGVNRAVVKEFRGIEASSELTLKFTKVRGEPLISGIEIVAEQ